MAAVQVYLVPGFFGFVQIGDLNYFNRVRELLGAALEARNVDWAAVSKDQGAVTQITPESMQLFNATVSDRSSAHYNCLVTASPPPRAFDRANFQTVETAALFMVFTLLHKITGRESRRYPYPDLDAAVVEKMRSQLPFELSEKTNDGVVPTESQVYGEVLDVVVADHLDVVGRFHNPQKNASGDWFPSGSGFDEERFVRVWDRIADAIAGTLQ